MARLKTRSKVIGVIILALALPIGWWLLSPLFISKTVNESFPKSGATASTSNVKAGTFRDADSFHKGSGEATIHRVADGSHVLRLENFNSTNGPDLHVYLATHPNPKKSSEIKGQGFVNLGRLKGNIGNQNYTIPANVDLSKQGSVIIYCRAFSTIFSVASLK